MILTICHLSFVSQQEARAFRIKDDIPFFLEMLVIVLLYVLKFLIPVAAASLLQVCTRFKKMEQAA